MERLDYDKDERMPADNARRIVFRKGWQRGAKGKPYKPHDLDTLNWQNLGYRMGKLLKDAPDGLIDVMYAVCAMLQREQKEKK
jgi:hypothetical protein